MLSSRLALLSLLGALTCTPAVQAATLSLAPASIEVSNNDTVVFDLVVDGLGDLAAPSLAAFDLGISFDDAALDFVGYTLGSFLGDLATSEALDISIGLTGTGAVNVAELSVLSSIELDALQGSSFVVAMLEFRVSDLLPGARTAIGIDPNGLLLDGPGTLIDVDAATGATLTGRGGTVALPLPGTLGIVLAGAMVLGGVRRLRRL